MLTSNTRAIPEQGQIVTIRQRRYVVADVLRSTLSFDPLLNQSMLQHLVVLNAIEDDALGETLQVIWELEPGGQISEKVALPTPIGFDTPHRLDAFLDAVRWGAISTSDTRALQAPFRSGIEIADYQLNPLVRAVQMPRVSLLIADDVGLGKTIEAGLVIQELIIRNRARSVLVACPAGLQIHWRDQMRDKFGLDFRIVDSELMKQLRRSRGLHVNPWAHFPRLITSIDFLKRERPMRLLRETLPAEGESIYPRRYDILIVDEAHNVAPSGRGQYAVDSLRTEAIRTLTPHFEHKLFLSATPHNGYQESFSALLELLDNQRFARGVMPDRKQLEAVMIRRLKSELPPDWDGAPRFPQRRLHVIEVEYSEGERQVHRWLKEYTELRQRNTRDDTERYATEFVLKLLKKRLFSSPAAFAKTLERHQQSISSGTERIKLVSRSTVGILRQQVERIEEDYADDTEYESVADGAIEAASQLFREPDPHEQKLLSQMQQWAEQASERRDSKTQELVRWLHETLKPNGKWSDERVIIFTEYKATLNWLQTILAAEGLASNERLLTLYGGLESEEREQVKAAFQAHPAISSVRILLATDAASEGIDLQNHCHRLIHMEIPWNPNRLEQRNGRIDRHGQKHDPLIYHFAGHGYAARMTDEIMPADDLDGDLEFLMRAVQKVETIREDLGKVGPVIAQQVEEAMLGRRQRLDTQHAENEAGAVRKVLKFERDLRKQIDAQVAQLNETKRDLGLLPENIEAVVKIALELAGQPPLRPVVVNDIQAFQVPPLSGSWAACAEGLAHPHTGEIRPIVFDHEVVTGRDDVVLAHLNHRLVQMSLRLLRAEVWSPGGRKGLHRVTARIVPSHVLDTVAVIAHARLVIIGGDSYRLHEEVIAAGGRIETGSFQRMKVTEVRDILNAQTDKPVSESMQRQLAAIWSKIEHNLMNALEARMQDRAERLQKLLGERAEKESDDIEAILRELGAAIEHELDEPEYRQLELFTLDERTQLTRNTTALRARLDRIPTEIEDEKALIRERYADPNPRLFPVAVTFLVPERLAR